MRGELDVGISVGRLSPNKIRWPGQEQARDRRERVRSVQAHGCVLEQSGLVPAARFVTHESWSWLFLFTDSAVLVSSYRESCKL